MHTELDFFYFNYFGISELFSILTIYKQSNRAKKKSLLIRDFNKCRAYNYSFRAFLESTIEIYKR